MKDFWLKVNWLVQTKHIFYYLFIHHETIGNITVTMVTLPQACLYVHYVMSCHDDDVQMNQFND